MAPSNMTPHDGGEPTLCTCECHAHPAGFGAVKHIMPCCTTCESCGRPFSAGLEKHRETCRR